MVTLIRFNMYRLPILCKQNNRKFDFSSNMSEGFAQHLFSFVLWQLVSRRIIAIHSNYSYRIKQAWNGNVSCWLFWEYYQRILWDCISLSFCAPAIAMSFLSDCEDFCCASIQIYSFLYIKTSLNTFLQAFHVAVQFHYYQFKSWLHILYILKIIMHPLH